MLNLWHYDANLGIQPTESNYIFPRKCFHTFDNYAASRADSIDLYHVTLQRYHFNL